MKKARQILAIIGLILIAVMYVLTIVFALSKNPDSKNWLMAAIFCTIAVPVLLYAMQLVAKVLAGRGANRTKDDDSKEDE